VENGAVVRSLSTRPINRVITKQKFFKGEKEQEKGILYDYIPFFNIKLLREFSVLFGIFFRILLARGIRKDTVVICDGLNIAASIGTISASFLRGFHTVGIVTDVPGHLSYSRKFSCAQKLNLAIMRCFGSYLLLTEQMNEVVNPQNRPYIVMEGHSDQAMAAVDNTLEGKNAKRIVLYAGSLMEIYGIKNLVEGFIASNIPNAELHIYGSGDYEQKLKQQCEKYDNVKYLGVAANSEIVKAEIEATLLVNPRPSHEDYTKYSFPSKNMEYMASGTPLLTTKLPGMPEDHLEHVYLIEDESAEGIACALRELCLKNEKELFEKGRKAKQFILEEKSNIRQAKKLLNFLENMDI
jgi:glycosyltransferase involved in cell wall biosynthesis